MVSCDQWSDILPLTRVSYQSQIRGVAMAEIPSPSPFRSIKASLKLTDQVLDQIQGAIMSGDFQRGKRLPPERELAETFGVGRSVVREAMRALEQKGLVEIRHGLGVFVSPSMDHVISDSLGLLVDLQHVPFIDVFEVRSVLEVGVVGFAATRATQEDLNNLEASIGEMERAKELEDPARYVPADLAFHRTLAEAAHNDFFLVLFRAFEKPLGSFVADTIATLEQIQEGLKDHRGILEAVRRGDPGEARKLMWRHLCNSVERYKDKDGRQRTMPASGWVD
jgi:GntR family transcriptional repressor for pyruvate dehydrogenase complex